MSLSKINGNANIKLLVEGSPDYGMNDVPSYKFNRGLVCICLVSTYLKYTYTYI